MLESLGARLRRRREERGIDLVTIARQTKIKEALLEALERDDVSQWPTGFYRRAFIRAYAQAIDLDPDTVLREFQEVHPEPPAVDVVAAMASTLGVVHGTGAIGRVRTVADLAIGSLTRLRRGTVGNDASVANDSPSALPAVSAPAGGDAPNPRASANHDRPGTHVDLPPRAAESQANATPDVSGAGEPAASTTEAPSDRRAVAPVAASDADLVAVAGLCLAFARAANTTDVQELLQDFATLVGASGLIVWLWDGVAEELKPALVHGYSEQVIAILPTVRYDADNATAMAFRAARTCEVAGNEQTKAALVVPLLTRAGCTGVLAIELQHRHEPAHSVRAIATILAVLLAQMTIEIAPAQLQAPQIPPQAAVS